MATRSEIKKNGLFDIINFLYYDLVLFLKEENRYVGKVKKCCDAIEKCVKHIERDASEDDCLYYGQILGQIKPRLIHEYKRLRKKSLGKADCVICFILKLSEIILDSIEEGDIFLYRDEVEKILSITETLHSNIRNWNKDDKLVKLWNDIDRLMRPKTIITGVPIDEFSLYKIEHPDEDGNNLRKTKPDTKTNKGSVKVKEIEL